MSSFIFQHEGDSNDQGFIKFSVTCLGRYDSIGVLRDVSDLTMNSFRSVGYTVTVSRIGVPVWSYAVLNTSKTLTRPSWGKLKNEASEPSAFDHDPCGIRPAQAEGFLQVFHGADRDIVGLDEPVRP